MPPASFPLLSIVFLFLPTLTLAAFYYPSPILSTLETLLVSSYGAHATNFSSAITPCSHYVSGPQTLGRTTAAQWLRVAFHDFVTADVVAGTGGIDASIGYETQRAEDVGSAFNDTLAFLANWVDARISMADMIAVAVTFSLSHCGGPILPLRGGRIDALSAGNFGVPEPDTSLEETLAEFASAGFSASDSIALTACGHSLGNVHHAGFPTVADNSTVSLNNTGGGQHFDDTPDVFDDLVVREYLAGTGHMGGPLVTSFNVSSRSDARLYASDGNATMRALVVQSGTFVEKCRVLFTRMIDTVPAEVVLTDVVEPVAVKPVNVSLDIDAAGHLKFAGSIRYLSAEDHTHVPATGIITLGGGMRNFRVDLEADPDTGYGVFGNTTYFPFSISVPSNTTFPDTFSVALGSETTNFTLQNQVFFAQSLSSIIPSTEGLLELNISAVASFIGMLPDKLTASVAVPTSQQLTLSPEIVTSTVVLQQSGAVGVYAVFSGVVKVREEFLRMTTVDIEAVVGGVTVTDEYNHLVNLVRAG